MIEVPSVESWIVTDVFWAAQDEAVREQMADIGYLVPASQRRTGYSPVLLGSLAVAIFVLVVAVYQPGALARVQPVRVVVNGHAITFARPPIMRQGRVLVPFREILHPLGLTGSLDEEAAHASAGKPPAIILRAGHLAAYVIVADGDCREETLDVAPTRQGDVFLVPLRSLAEGTGVQVSWDTKTRTVFLAFDRAQPRVAIHPPAAVKSVLLSGTWQVQPSSVGPLTCATCNEFPLTMGLQVLQGGSPPGPPILVRVGHPIPFSIGFTNLSPKDVIITRPVNLRVRISRGGCPVVWEGRLPELEAAIPPGSAHFRFVWDQRSAGGRLVGKGIYFAKIVFPVTIHYTTDGISAEERLTSTSAHSLGGEIDFQNISIQ